MFILNRPFQSSLVLAGKVRAYPGVEYLKGASLGYAWPYPQESDSGGKLCLSKKISKLSILIFPLFSVLMTFNKICKKDCPQTHSGPLEP